MKPLVRVLGIDDGPHDKFSQKGKQTIVVGVVTRGNDMVDGVLSTKVIIDGNNATSRISSMINSSKHFKSQLKAVFLDGIAFGGFNVVDIQALSEEITLPVITIMRTYPRFEKIKKALININKKNKIKFIEKAGQPIKLGKIWFQCSGCNEKTAKEIITISTKNSYIPECLRLAHIIATGVVRGESSGGY